jgi:hypothetical protein
VKMKLISYWRPRQSSPSGSWRAVRTDVAQGRTVLVVGPPVIDGMTHLGIRCNFSRFSDCGSCLEP